MKLSKSVDTKLGVQISPLIDVVFLLLIYFMVTSSLIRKEADMSFTLPASDRTPAVMPIEIVVQIDADGTVDLNGIRYASEDQSLSELTGRITQLQALANAQQTAFVVSILPNDQALHHRIIDVMDACAEAGVRHLAFAQAY